jgi:glyoxylase-like metal-dependent hydrolase (beta-lactamase superfamily II)
VRNLKEGDEFLVDESLNGVKSTSILGSIETPGHRSDHCSFFLKNKDLEQNILFPCDMILGSPSVSLASF